MLCVVWLKKCTKSLSPFFWYISNLPLAVIRSFHWPLPAAMRQISVPFLPHGALGVLVGSFHFLIRRYWWKVPFNYRFLIKIFNWVYLDNYLIIPRYIVVYLCGSVNFFIWWLRAVLGVADCPLLVLFMWEFMIITAVGFINVLKIQCIEYMFM